MWISTSLWWIGRMNSSPIVDPCSQTTVAGVGLGLVRLLDGQRPQDLVAQLRLEVVEAALPGGGALAQQGGEDFAAGRGHALSGAPFRDQG